MSCINITTAAAAAASATTTTNNISSSSASSSSSSSHPHNPADPTLPPPPQQIPIINPSEQLCYVHCTLCDTVLVVSVPCASLFKTVTVRCGHCSNLLPVSMRALTLIHPHHHQQQQQLHFPPNLLAMAPTSNANTNTTTPTAPRPTPTHTSPSNFLEDIHCSTTSAPSFSLNQQISNFVSTGNNSTNTNIPLMVNDHLLPDPRLAVTPPQLVVNRPPEKRQRVPSAYNRFIKDEIQRIKAGNPDISHREAFSAAAKNWAHFPHIHFGLMPGHHAMRKTNMCPQVYANPQNQSQDGDDIITKDDLFASANFGILPY